MTTGIDLLAVPRGIANKVKRGNRVDWEIDDVIIENYYHIIWKNMYNSLEMSMTKRFQGKSIDIARDFQDILSNLEEGAEFTNMNSPMELYTMYRYQLEVFEDGDGSMEAVA